MVVCSSQDFQIILGSSESGTGAFQCKGLFRKHNYEFLSGGVKLILVNCVVHKGPFYFLVTHETVSNDGQTVLIQTSMHWILK